MDEYPGYNVFELRWPEKETYEDNDIVWWKKGNEVDGYWYKAEAPNHYVIELGYTLNDAINSVIYWIEHEIGD